MVRDAPSDAAGKVKACQESVLASGKYSALSPELVGRIAASEVSRRRSQAELVRAVKRRLHQVCGAYVSSRADRGIAASMAGVDPGSGLEAFKPACLAAMGRHASTRERTPFLGRFYSTLFEAAGSPESVLDLGCGFNPLALPWMPGGERLEYKAVDARLDVVEGVNCFFRLSGRKGIAESADLCQGPPTFEADLALVLKLLPCLERVDPEAPLRLLRGIKAKAVAVSFPSRTLCGREKGFAANYEARFAVAVGSEGIEPAVLRFPNETVFLWFPGGVSGGPGGP